MVSPQPLASVNFAIWGALKSGHRVWVVGSGRLSYPGDSSCPPLLSRTQLRPGARIWRAASLRGSRLDADRRSGPVMSAEVSVKALVRSDGLEPFRQIAALHIRLIHGGILPELGERFLTNLYREIAASRHGCVHAAFAGGRVVGFVVGASDIWKCALSFRPGGCLRLGALLLTRLWRLSILERVLGSLTYPFRNARVPDRGAAPLSIHRAELLAIAVAETAQGRGIGRLLVQALETFLAAPVTHYFVSTNVQEKQSNAFYRELGFSPAGQMRHHDLVVQLYIKALGQTASPERLSS